MFDEAVTIARSLRGSDLLACALSFQALYRWGADDEGAITAATAAIPLLEPLVARQPGRYGLHLIQAKMAIANTKFNLGQPEDALPHVADLVRSFRTLASAEPEKYEDQLAWMLDLEGRCLRDTGRRDEARERATEAVAIQRRLVESGQEHYLSDLASALCNLGDLEDAEQHYLEAVEIRRRLGEGETAHVSELLYLSVRPLSQNGRVDDARRVGVEALTLSRTVAEADSGHAGMVPKALWALGSVGEPAERLAYLDEAVSTWRAAAVPDPEEFAATLAAMLVDLASCLDKNGRDGRAAAQEAVELFREQALDWPDRYLHDFRDAEDALQAVTDSWSHRR